MITGGEYEHEEYLDSNAALFGVCEDGLIVLIELIYHPP